VSVATGRVQGGQLVFDEQPKPLPEGKRFTLVIDDEEDDAPLTAEQVRLLREAESGIRAGKFFTEEEILKDLEGE
jgi:hypothetical protein